MAFECIRRSCSDREKADRVWKWTLDKERWIDKDFLHEYHKRRSQKTRHSQSTDSPRSVDSQCLSQCSWTTQGSQLGQSRLAASIDGTQSALHKIEARMQSDLSRPTSQQDDRSLSLRLKSQKDIFKLDADIAEKFLERFKTKNQPHQVYNNIGERFADMRLRKNDRQLPRSTERAKSCSSLGSRREKAARTQR